MHGEVADVIVVHFKLRELAAGQVAEGREVAVLVAPVALLLAAFPQLPHYHLGIIQASG